MAENSVGGYESSSGVNTNSNLETVNCNTDVKKYFGFYDKRKYLSICGCVIGILLFFIFSICSFNASSNHYKNMQSFLQKKGLTMKQSRISWNLENSEFWTGVVFSVLGIGMLPVTIIVLKKTTVCATA